eukprot:TRINITY_DN367_c0_g1_i1.p1 TRINITY_DN367_c0_g1~~TRINITY_DN367_c0_g1_i1.p1  ORF type:complete len:239 (-),score=46.09 TRINITY_DN367_c0_g1_i1:66-740(-)
MSDYGNKAYWNERYKKEPEPFEWYQSYENLKTFIEPHVPKTAAILHIGCGNSKLCEDMVNDGYTKIVNIDISSVVISDMKERYKNNPKLEFCVMDCRTLDFEDKSFGVVIDKGTLDAVLCGDNSFYNAALMMKEIYRVLTPGGVFIEVSYGGPDMRLTHLKNQTGWTIETRTIRKTYHSGTEDEDAHFMYIMTKTTNPSEPNSVSPDSYLKINILEDDEESNQE